MRLALCRPRTAVCLFSSLPQSLIPASFIHGSCATPSYFSPAPPSICYALNPSKHSRALIHTPSNRFLSSMSIETSSQEPVVSTPVTEKPLLDNREYKVIQLKNGLEALLIHDAETDKASAAIDVNVGSYSDPDDLNGLAHFCEHLLFMGTEKYPKENEYSRYLSAHAGHSNAYTSSDDTNYYFEVGHDHLEGALERFAQFFIAPLFSASCKDREIRAVDSENKKNLQNDMWRLHQLDRSLSNPDHPVSKFSTGNLITLETEPLTRNVDVRERLLEFYNGHYSANLMKLCVIGRESIEQLESWTVEKFTDVKNTNRSTPSYAPPPFTQDQLLCLIKAEPVKDIKRLSLRFPIPDQQPLYEKKPSHYLSHCLGHEGSGSLLHYFKEKGWASQLSAGAMHISKGYEHFIIDIDLTPAGLEEYEQVIVTIFQYLKIVHATPIEEWRYKELKTMSGVNFKFRSKQSASRTTSNMSAHMQKPIPRERLLSSSLFRKFDPDLVAKTASYLNPDNFRATLVAQSLTGLDKTERWYGTKYSVEKFSPDFLKKLQNVGFHPDLHLPNQNEFIPENLDVNKKQVLSPMKHPILLKNTQQLRLWYKKDDTFWMPKACVRIYLKAPLTFSSPSSYVKTSLFMDLLEDELLPFAYAAEIAGLDYAVTTSRDGIVINASGYNDKIHVLLEDILKTLKGIKLDEARFDVWKERNLRSYRNLGLNNPYTQIGTHANYLFNELTWTLDEKEQALTEVTFKDLVEFAPQILRHTNAEVLAFGNLTKEEAVKISDLTFEILKPLPLTPSQSVRLRSYILPPGKEYHYRIPLIDEENVNSCIEYYIQVGLLTNHRLRLALELFSSIMSEPAFNQLRTREQLGYVVFSGIRHTRTTFGYRVLVQSERDTTYLKNRIDNFLTGMADILGKLSDEEFKRYVTSLTTKRQEKHQNVGEEADSYFSQLQSGYYHFLSHDEDVEALKTITKDELKELYETYISPESDTRSCFILDLEAQKVPEVSMDKLLGAVFANLAHKHEMDVDPSDVGELAAKTVGKAPHEIMGIVGEVLVSKGHGNIAEQFLSEASDEVARQTGPQVRTGQDIENLADFKSSLGLTAAPMPVVDLSTYSEQGSKL